MSTLLTFIGVYVGCIVLVIVTVKAVEFVMRWWGWEDRW